MGKKTTTRALEIHEYNEIIHLFLNGFKRSEESKCRPNRQIALALQLQATLGLRIGDTLNLKVNNFRHNKLELREKKGGKLQYREINPSVSFSVMEYALAKNLRPDDKLFSIEVRAVQKQLKVITDHLGLENIGTHSFRKMFATTVYEDNAHNLELVKELLNHGSIATTQRYIRVSQKAIDKASASVNFM